jgi:short-subunit dehydrogenase
MKRIVLVGATSAIAGEYARQVSSINPVNFTLIGRNKKQLDLQAKDLTVRNPECLVEVISGDLESPDFVSSVMESFANEIQIDVVLIAQGSLPNQQLVEQSPEYLAKSLSINAASPAMFADAFAEILMKQTSKSVIAIIGSVAGDRGRKSNYAYGAAKSFIETFVRGLQHRLFDTGVCVLLIKPGPVDTPMTANLSIGRKGLASKELVAKEINTAISQRKKTLYTPAKWSLIMAVIRAIPSSIFNRLDI